MGCANGMPCQEYEGALVNHTFVNVYMRGFGYYILLDACRNKGNHYETTKDNETDF